jgi:serine/threonine protein kinase
MSSLGDTFPRQFGHYFLERPLAAGGMGEVFLAVARGLRHRCVVKTILPDYVDDEALVHRFRDEAKIMVHIDHEHVVRCFDYGQVDGVYYIAMEYVHGRSLASLLDRTYATAARMPVPIGLHVADRVLEALAYIHKAKDRTGRAIGLVHRDLSPDNVLVGFDGAVKVADFGLARTDILPSRTLGQVPLGKWGYMSPEQALHEPIDGRGDLYALGSTMFEVLTGQRLIDDNEEDMTALWERVLTPKHPRPSEVRKGVPREIDDWLLKAVQIQPEDRYRDAEAMQAALRSLDTSMATKDELVRYVRALFPELPAEPPPAPDVSRLPVERDRSIVFALSERTARNVFGEMELPAELSDPGLSDDEVTQLALRAPSSPGEDVIGGPTVAERRHSRDFSVFSERTAEDRPEHRERDRLLEPSLPAGVDGQTDFEAAPTRLSPRDAPDPRGHRALPALPTVKLPRVEEEDETPARPSRGAQATRLDEPPTLAPADDDERGPMRGPTTKVDAALAALEAAHAEASAAALSMTLPKKTRVAAPPRATPPADPPTRRLEPPPAQRRWLVPALVAAAVAAVAVALLSR